MRPLLDAIAHLLAGRFSRARKAAQAALAQERTLAALEPRCRRRSRCARWRTCSRPRARRRCRTEPARDAHLQQALNESAERGAPARARDARRRAAARRALGAGRPRPAAALARLEELPQGAQRRTLALRLRLKAARQDRRTLRGAGDRAPAGQAPRVFRVGGAEHRARAGDRTARPARTTRRSCSGPGRCSRPASARCPRWRSMPRSAWWRCAATSRWRAPGCCRSGSAWSAQPQSLGDALARQAGARARGRPRLGRRRLAGAHRGAQRNNPRDANLQYLAGMACMKRQLWGKAQQLAHAGRLGPAGRESAPPRLAGPGAAGRGTRGRRRAGSAAWKRAAQTENP